MVTLFRTTIVLLYHKKLTFTSFFIEKNVV